MSKKLFHFVAGRFQASGFTYKTAAWLFILNVMIWLLAAYSINEDRKEHEGRMRTTVRNLSQILAYDLNAMFRRADLLLHSIKDEAEGQLRQGGLNRIAINGYLSRHQSHLPEIAGLRLTDATGNVRFGEGLPNGKAINVSDRDYYRQARDQERSSMAITRPIQSRINNEWIIPVARRINKPDGEFAGVVYATIPVSYFTRKFSSLNLGHQGVVTLRSDDHLSFARFPELEGSDSLGKRVLSEELRDLLKSQPQETTYFAPSPADKISRLFSYRKLEDYPMNVVVGIASDEVRREWLHDTVQTLTLTGMISVISIMFGFIQASAWRKQQITHLKLQEMEQRWSLALESGNFTVWDWDMPAGKVYLSKLGKQMFGFGDDEIGDEMSGWEARTHPDELERIIQKMKDHFRHRAPCFVAEYRVRCKDESWKWIYSRGLVVKRASDGKPLRMIGIHADISQRKKLEEEMRLANTAYSMANEAMLVTDEQNRIISVNAAFTRITGYTLDEAKGKNPSMLSAKQHDRDFYNRMWGDLVNTGNWSGEVLNRRKNGQTFHEWLSIKRIMDDHGRVINHVAVFSDISNRKEAEARIRHLALHDALTGMPNRALLQERMEQAVLRSQRDKTKFAVLYFDLDKFKPINDVHGHEVGDWLLIQVAERVQASVRESDTVARIGGDEFIVLLAKIESAEDALKVANKILKELTRPFDFAQIKLNISSSIGIAIYPAHGQNEKTLTRHGDAAMYRAKKNGRGQVVIYEPGMELGID